MTVAPEVVVHTLSNGLTVYAVESHAQPLVTLDAWVKAGSRDEPSHLAGISHFLEHMLFKGTERLAVGQYDRRIEELGGYLNAATSSDYTHYYLTLPSDQLDRALEDMADVLTGSTLVPHEVEKERHVILEEIRQKQDNPIGFLYDEITRKTYESGPYAGTVIGSSETVGAMTREQLREHYHRFYAPSNMVFVAVGHFETKALLERLEKLFQPFQRDFRPWRQDPPPTVFRPPQEVLWKRDWQQTYLFFSFPSKPQTTLAQVAALDVAETVLIGGRSARLINSLVEKKRLAQSFSGFLAVHPYPGFMAFYGTCESDKVPELRSAFLDELERLRRDGLKPGELARAKRMSRNGHLYQTETNTGKATMLGYSFALLGTPDLLTALPVLLDSVTEEAVLAEVAEMTPERISTFVAHPTQGSAS